MTQHEQALTGDLTPIRLLLADDSDVLRHAIYTLLSDEPRIRIVAEAKDFAEMLAKTAELKPRVVLMDLHMGDESAFTPDFIKSKLLASARCILAMSFWRDAETAELSEAYGASLLLDKSNLHSELIPAITKYCA